MHLYVVKIPHIVDKQKECIESRDAPYQNLLISEGGVRLVDLVAEDVQIGENSSYRGFHLVRGESQLSRSLGLPFSFIRKKQKGTFGRQNGRDMHRQIRSLRTLNRPFPCHRLRTRFIPNESSDRGTQLFILHYAGQRSTSSGQILSVTPQHSGGRSIAIEEKEILVDNYHAVRHGPEEPRQLPMCWEYAPTCRGHLPPLP